VAKQAIAVYHSDIFSCLVAGSRILVTINIYLQPQSYHKFFVGEHYFD